MNCIREIKFDFDMQSEVFARDLYSRWDNFFALNFERIADSVLAKHDKTGYTVEIERLELDMGVFDEQDFYEYFPLRMEEKLEEALLKQLYYPHTSGAEQVKGDMYLFEVLSGFLLNGFLPWSVPSEYKNISRLFTTVLRRQASMLRHFLRTYGHYTSLQERLVYQLDDPDLEKGVYLLERGNAFFICSYVRFLHAGYKNAKLPGVAGYSYKSFVWLVVYAYLLNNRSSYFNKKSFIAQTVMRLAAKNNLSYDDFLEMITNELEKFSRLMIVPAELFNILKDLRAELSRKRLNENSAYDAAGFYRTISGLLREELQENISESVRESLIRILSRPDSCRIFLRQMDERKIIEMVPVVAPHESDFIIGTAKALDKQKEGGALQGKAGGEFRLLKWQIIFPLLFVNRGAGLNRRYFVERVLRQIAAHYNLELLDILKYIDKNDLYLNFPDKDLREIFAGLYLSCGESISLLSPDTERFPDFDSFWRSDRPEAGYYELAERLVPGEGRFIIGYANSLDRLKERGALEGRASGEFRHLKWKFIFTVLREVPEEGFNRRTFVEQTLHQIAAHYNLSYPDLLGYFRKASVGFYLPFELQILLTELFLEERDTWIKTVLEGTDEKDKFYLVEILRPDEHLFIKDYVRALDSFHSGSLLQGKVSGELSRIKWRFVFEVLLELQNSAFNKKYFIRRTLCGIAAHYNLSLYEILSYLYPESFDLSWGASFRTVSIIIKELYREEVKIRRTERRDNINNYAVREAERLFLSGAGVLSVPERRMLEQLFERTEFISLSGELFKFISRLRRYFKEAFGLSLNNIGLIELLLQLSSFYWKMSGSEILESVAVWAAKDLRSVQKAHFRKVLWRWGVNVNPETVFQGSGSGLFPATGADMYHSIREKERGLPVKDDAPEMESGFIRFIDNAGLVLLSPYLPRLFSMLNLIGNDVFKNREAVIRAMFILQYAVSGDLSAVPEGTAVQFECREHEMTLNMLLTGHVPGEPVPRVIDFTDKEVGTVISLLHGVLNNWPKLRGTSLEGLREAFLNRAGKLTGKKDSYILTVEEKPYDMLVDTVPWNFKTIKYPWMEKVIHVQWR